ncbi:MAG: NRDE family protein [Anaeromyxobacter sp.]
MCTLALGLGLDRRWPVVIAANRDERLGRASEGWALRAGAGGLRHAAPADRLAGGTWIGVSAGGLVAAVTNYHAPFDWYPDPARRSRGELVPLALAAGSVDAAAEALRPLEAARWNPFHLVVAGPDGALLWWHDGEAAGLERLDPGLHVITESDRTGRGPRAERVRARWPAEPAVERLREVLVQHDGRDGTCIHGDPVYGTRSSTVLRLARDLAASDLFVADGRPCQSPLEDRSPLLEALARSA